MFSGIVETTCPVVAAHGSGSSRRLEVDLADLLALGESADPDERMIFTTSWWLAHLKRARKGDARPSLGDSVAVSGVCLTVADRSGTICAFDVVAETLRCSNLGSTAAGSRVNVERALRYGERVDGHLVQGHVETTGEVLSLAEQPGQTWLTIGCGADFAARCLPKGSLAIDGVSLTLAELGDDTLSVALVPHTLERTTLGTLRPGDRVNLEPDMLGQWVLASLARSAG